MQIITWKNIFVVGMYCFEDLDHFPGSVWTMLEKIKKQFWINEAQAPGRGAAVPPHGSSPGPRLQGYYARVEGLTKKRACSPQCLVYFGVGDGGANNLHGQWEEG